MHLLHAYDNAPVATRGARAHAALEATLQNHLVAEEEGDAFIYHGVVIGSGNGNACITCHRGL